GRVAVAARQVLGVRCRPPGPPGLAHIIQDIRGLKPDFILNSLVGDSSYAFLARLAELKRDALFASRPTVLSCNFTECEIEAAGAGADGLISAGPWFEPDGGSGGSLQEMARRSVLELARLLHGNPGSEALSLSDLIHSAIRAGKTTQLDPVHHHTTQESVLAGQEHGKFCEIKRLTFTRADPYLTYRSQNLQGGSMLKVVS